MVPLGLVKFLEQSSEPGYQKGMGGEGKRHGIRDQLFSTASSASGLFKYLGHIPLLTGFLFLLKWSLEQHTVPIYVSSPQASLPFGQKSGR